VWSRALALSCIKTPPRMLSLPFRLPVFGGCHPSDRSDRVRRERRDALEHRSDCAPQRVQAGLRRLLDGLRA
jgi:hypothetical protein